MLFEYNAFFCQRERKGILWNLGPLIFATFVMSSIPRLPTKNQYTLFSKIGPSDQITKISTR